MDFSRYNVYVKENDVVTIFNTFTSALVQLNNDSFENLLTSDANSETAEKLLDMGILVNNRNEEIQKYKYIQYSRMFRNNQMLLYICPTMNCNFSCSYCFEAGNKTKTNMSTEVEDAIVRFISQNRNKKISIIWFGGEPLLNVNTIKNITDRLNKEQINYSSSMITNGSLLTKHAVDILKTVSIEFIQISMDGTKAVHDIRRHFRSGKGSFDAIIEGINRILSETSIPITIQVAIDKTNYREYEKLVSYFNNNFSSHVDEKRIQLNFNVVKDRTNFDIQGTCMSHQDYFHYLNRLNKLDLKNKMGLFLPKMSQPCMYHTVGAYAITPDGEIYKCIEHVGNPQKSVGNILKENMSLSKLSMCMFENNCLENTDCINCPVLPICGGGCPLDRAVDNGKNNIACSFYKKYIDKILSCVKL